MLYLSRATGRPVLDAGGEPIGTVVDLIVAVGHRNSPFSGLVVLIFNPESDHRKPFMKAESKPRNSSAPENLSQPSASVPDQLSKTSPGSRRPRPRASPRGRPRSSHRTYSIGFAPLPGRDSVAALLPLKPRGPVR